MNRRIAALIAAGLLAAAVPSAAGLCAGADATVEQALTGPCTDALACALTAAREDWPTADGARCAYVSGDVFLYIDAQDALIRRTPEGEVTLAEGISMLTHVTEDSVFVLTSAVSPADAPSGEGNGWDVIDSRYDGAPGTGRELSGAHDWARLSLSGGEPEPLMQGVASVPIVTGGRAYALDASCGGVLCGDLSGASRLVYSPEGEGLELRLRPAPGGVICALYDEGLLRGCCLLDEQGAQAAPLWTAGAEFHDGFALSFSGGEDGSGRKGLYLITAEGERLLDEHADPDTLCVGGRAYFWHADPEQAYGFRDLMALEPLSGGEPEPVAGGEQLRAQLFAFEGAIYFSNYDSELYLLSENGDEPEYVMDLSVDADFDSDMMPQLTLYRTDTGLGALLYLDEGDEPRFLGEATEG